MRSSAAQLRYGGGVVVVFVGALFSADEELINTESFRCVSYGDAATHTADHSDEAHAKVAAISGNPSSTFAVA